MRVYRCSVNDLKLHLAGQLVSLCTWSNQVLQVERCNSINFCSKENLAGTEYLKGFLVDLGISLEVITAQTLAGGKWHKIIIASPVGHVLITRDLTRAECH